MRPILMALALTVFAFAGCGGNDTPPGGAQPAAPTDTDPGSDTENGSDTE